MKKKLFVAVGVFCITVVLLIIVSELVLRSNILGPKKKYHWTVNPPDFFDIDSVLGWKLHPGIYTLSVWDSSNTFKATINSKGNRITSDFDTNEKKKDGPSIQIYGCSYTFGFSVADSATSSYKLQQLLPNVKVVNKGVPAYGLAQMFLSLKETLKDGDTPTVAVFNYAYFHDIRTPLNKNWSALLGYAITDGYSPRFKDMNYPYFQYINDSLYLQYCMFNELSRDWPYADQLSLIKMLNRAVYAIQDIRIARHLHLVSQKTALAIMQYCKSNHIIPVFASVTPGHNDILDSLSAKGYYTLDYNILVWDKYKANKYNCAPFDPEHPNGLAHTIYARKLYDFIKEKKLFITS